MQIVSSEFKDVIKRNAVFSDGFFVISNNDDYYETFESSDFMSMEIQATAFQNKRMFGNIAQTALSLELLGDTTTTIPFQDELKITPSIGVRLDNNSHEYVSFQGFNLSEFSYNPDTNITRMVATDDLVKLNKAYHGTTTFPTTLKNYLDHIFGYCGISLDTSIDFLNHNFVIQSKPFNEGTICREIVIKGLELALSNLVIDKNNGKAKFITAFPNLDNIDDTLNTNNYWNFKLTENNFKTNGINTLVLGISQVVGENVSKQNASNVGVDGDIEIIINDNDFIYTQDLRTSVLNGMFNVIDGYQYLPYHVEYRGFPYLEIGDVVELTDTKEGTQVLPIYEVFMRYDGGLFGKLKSEGVSTTQTKNKFQPNLNTRLRNAEISVDKVNARVDINALDIGENESKISQLRLDVNGLASTVSELGGGNLIPNPIGEFGITGWTFETVGLYPNAGLYPAPHIYPLGTNGAIMNVVNVVGASNETGFMLWHTGKALSDYGMVLGGEKYSLYIRYQGASGTVFKVREYSSETPVDKNSHTNETTLGTTTTQGSWTTLSDSIITDENTKSVVLVIESGASAYTSTTLTFTDVSFNFGNPKPYAQSLTDISLKADLAYTTATQMADGFHLLVRKDEVIDEINLSSGLAKINWGKIEIEGLVTANQNFKILMDGSIEAQNALIKGNLVAGTIAGLTFNDTQIIYPNSQLKLDSTSNSIMFGTSKLQYYSPSGISNSDGFQLTGNQGLRPMVFDTRVHGGLLSVGEIVGDVANGLKLGYDYVKTNIKGDIELDGTSVKIYIGGALRTVTRDANGFLKAT